MRLTMMFWSLVSEQVWLPHHQHRRGSATLTPTRPPPPVKVILIEAVHAEPDYLQPWQMKRQINSTGIVVVACHIDSVWVLLPAFYRLPPPPLAWGSAAVGRDCLCGG